MDRFSYNAPDFFDFSEDLHYDDEKTVQKFFEVEHENHSSAPVDSPQAVNNSGEPDLEYEFYTPLKITPGKFTSTENCLQKDMNNLRRSFSMGNIVQTKNETSVETSDQMNIVSNSLEGLHVQQQKKSSEEKQQSSHAMMTRSRSTAKRLTNKLAQPRLKYASQEDLQSKKYVSMAEAINQFHQKTPKRFHSQAKADESTIVKHLGRPLPNTIPHSPALATKRRARPTHFLSREEQELKEYEEAKKNRIKAHPLNTKILTGPVQPKSTAVINKPPPTKPEPFKLTEVLPKKTLALPTPPPYTFHAKPLPKSTLEAPKPIIKSVLCTNPITPNLMKRYRVEHSKNEVVLENGGVKSKSQTLKLGPTKPIPFSFEQRDKEILKKREKLINEVLEEEKKAREFHAQPLPTNIFKSPRSDRNSSYYTKRQYSNVTLAARSEEDINLGHTFKAKPAKVLQIKPFEPKKVEDHVTQFAEFHLSTEERAKERERFEQKKKEKEERLTEILKQKEEEMLNKEKDEIRKLRILTEHKAQPIRRYKELQPVPSKKLTAPISPKFATKSKCKDSILVDEKENSVNGSNGLHS